MDLEATPEERLQLEYATQHFGFTPDAFVETVTTTVIDSINEGLDDTKKQLAESFRKKVSRQELDESFAVIKNKYVTSAEKVLDNFSRYVKRNILIVPKNVVLPEDNIHVLKSVRSENNLDKDKVSNISAEITLNTKPQDGINDDNEISSAEFYNGDNLIESIKGFGRQCDNIQNSKYKQAVLRAKLANLEIVARRQRILLKKAEELKETRHRLEDIIEKQEGVLDKKLNVLKVLQQNHQLSASDQDTTDSQIIGRQENKIDLTISKSITKTATEKRKIDAALFEEAVMAKKCRQFDDDNGYKAIEIENSKTNLTEIGENNSKTKSDP